MARDHYMPWESCSAMVHSGKDSFKTLPLVKRQKRKSAYQVTHNKGIPVHEYTPSDESGLSKIFFKSMLQLKRPYTAGTNYLAYCIFFHQGSTCKLVRLYVRRINWRLSR